MAININIPSQFREYNNFGSFPATGDSKVVYVAKNNNKIYRWDGAAYVELSTDAASSWGSIQGTLSNQTDLQTALDGKVNTEVGKGLSTNDYTTTEKNKLAGIASGAEVNVNADWNATSGDAEILNKPTIPSIAGLATTTYVDSQDATKQNTLVSGTNIKTIEGQSVLGSGNIDLTKSDVGLANVDNTSDLNKPISTATQTALNAKENTITAGTTSQYYRGDKTFQTLDKTAVGLSNVDNTSDVNKPISTATQTALNAKQDTLVSGTNIKTVNSTSLLGSGDVSVGVTSVTGTSPISSSGGATPAISIATANTSTTGALSSTDWNTFNNKQSALTLTTTGTSGAATLVGATLNIPQYSGSSSSGLQGIHALVPLSTGDAIAATVNATALTTGAMIVNRLWAMPFLPANTFTSSNLYINVTAAVASSLARILIYSDLNGKPNTKLYESADLDCSTIGVKTATTSFTFTAGTRYWLSFHSNSTQTISAISTGGLLVFKIVSSTAQYTSYIQTVTYGSAPASWGTTSGQNTLVPFIGITAA